MKGSSKCTCESIDSGIRFCISNQIFREQLTRFDCFSRCDKFQKDDCKFGEDADFSGCSPDCNICRNTASEVMEHICKKNSSPSSPSPAQTFTNNCANDSNCKFSPVNCFSLQANWLNFWAGASTCRCVKSEKGNFGNFCGNDNIFLLELERLECEAKCDGFQRIDCTLTGNVDFSGCSTTCKNCVVTANASTKRKCSLTSSSLPSPSPSPSLSPTMRFNPYCVSTQWVKEQGLSRYSVHHEGQANVICIPGLPCGTSGHLLRVCDSERISCELVSYSDLCKHIKICTSSVMPVSQLSHAYDWSSFRISLISFGITAELTSLSQHDRSSKFSISSLIAHITDYVNQKGYGRVCDAVARITQSIPKVLNLFSKTSSYWSDNDAFRRSYASSEVARWIVDVMFRIRHFSRSAVLK